MKQLLLVSLILASLSSCTNTATTEKNTSDLSHRNLNTKAMQRDHWKLVWSDEFSGSSVDTSKWTLSKNCFGGGNNELQCYTDHIENAQISNGQLHIIARKESNSGPAKEDSQHGYDPKDTSATRGYSSARLDSRHKGDWKYGRMEIKAKMPQGQGIWPAIWMLPSEWKYGVWPLSGELDIFEAINSNTSTFGNQIHGTLHYGELPPNNKLSGTQYSPSSNIWEDFHTYAIEWEEGEIRWYFDNTHFATQTKAAWFTTLSQNGKQVKSSNAEPFDQTFYLILNLAVGGEWPKSPDNTTTFPQQMDIDYVRIYRCNLDATTGKGCATHIDQNIRPDTPTTTK